MAAGATFLGFAFDAVSGSELTSAFSAMYFLGCVLAVLAVRKRGLFTAVVQPPLLLFVAVPLGSQFLTDGAGTGIKDMAINVAYPLVNRFPLMLAATVVVGLIAAARVFLVQPRTAAPTRTRERRAEARPARTGRNRPDRNRTDVRVPERGRDERTTVFEPVGDDRRAPQRASRPSYPAQEPAHVPTASHGGTYSGRGYDDTVHRRDVGRREPVRHDAPYREAPHREPVQRDPVSARPRRAAEVPAHPIPQVRYRDRRDQPPFEG